LNISSWLLHTKFSQQVNLHIFMVCKSVGLIVTIWNICVEHGIALT